MLKRTLIVLFALILGFTSVIDARAVVIDTFPPEVIGVEENGVYYQPVTITYEEGSGVLNDVAIESPKTVSDVGTYLLVVTDIAGNATTIHFSIADNIAPIVNGVTEGGKYSDPVTITFNEGTGLLNGAPFENGSTVEAIGSYTLVVTDASNNSTTIHFSRVAKTVAVTGLKAVNAGYNSIAISWAAITSISGYEIWRSTGTSTTYAYIGSLTANSYTNTGLAFNTRYNYKVRVYTLINNVKTYGAFSSVAYATTALLTPSLTVTSASYNSLKIAWNAIAGASGYQVYKSTSATGVYTLVSTTTATSYINPSLATNGLYFYKVRAYRTVGTTKYYSGYSSVQSARPIPSQVVSNTVVSAGYNSLKASWAAVAGANGYEVYRSESMDGTFALATTTTATSFVISAVATNVPVYVKVRAYRLVGTTKIYGAFSSIISGTPIPATPVLSIASPSFNSLRVSWAAIAGVSGYELYHLNSSTGLYELLHDGTDLFYLHTDLVSGMNHSYKIKAYTLIGETKVYSLDSSVVSNKAIPSIPALPKAVFANYNSITVSFNEVEGATGYEIYRSTAAAGVYALVTTTSSLSYMNTNLAFNTVYYYKVRAYTLVDSVKVYGNYTTVVSARTSVNTPVITPVSSGYDRITVSWAGITGANGYEVYQSTSTAGVYTLLATTASTSYTKTALVTNTSYFYKVRAYRLVGTIKVYSGYSTIVSAKPVPATPSVTVASAGYNSVKASWAAIAGASGYEISYSLSEDGTYTLLPHQTATSYTLANQATNQPVFFKVRAYRMVGTLKVFGNTSIIKSASPIPATPVVALSTLSYKSMKLTWPAIAGASGYEIYTKTGDDFVLSSDQTDLTITFDGLTSGVVQTYKVKAYTYVNEVKIYSNEVLVSGKALPLVPVVSAIINYNSIQLNWNPVEGASGYEVYRGATATGTYTLISTTEATSLAMNGLAFNTLYYVRVRAFTLVDSVKVYGNYTGNLAYRTSVATPTVTLSSTSYVSIRIGWSAITGATGYEVYRATSATGVYALVVTTASTSYINTGLATNGLYYYKVRSYRLVGTVKYYSGYSVVQSARPVPSAPTASTMMSSGYDSVKVSWPTVAGATGYEVHTSNAQDGTYVLSATTTALFANIGGFATNENVYAKVRAYRLVGTTKVYGSFGPVTFEKPIPATAVPSVTTLTYKSLKIQWPAVAGASGYEIYKINGSETILLQDGSQTELIVENLVCYELQEYKVVSYRLVNEVKVYGNAAFTSGKAYPLAPIVKGKSTNYSEILLEWNAQEGIEGYQIYRSTSATGTFSLLQDVDRMPATIDMDLPFNTTYYYKVRAYVVINSTQVFGPYSSVVAVKTALTVPTVRLRSLSYTGVSVQWDAVPGATGFEVSRSTTVNGVYTVLTAGVGGSSYSNTGLTADVTYFYRVRAYRLVGTVKVYSGYSTPVSIRPTPAAPAGIKLDSIGYDSLKMSWTASAGASGYEIYISDSQDGNYVLKSTTTSLSATLTGLPFNTVTYAKIRAYRTVGTTKYYGDYSAVYNAKTRLAKPVVTPTIIDVFTMNLTWPAIAGADGYFVEWDLGDGIYFLLDDVSTNAYLDEYMYPGDPYGYRITAYRIVGETIVISDSAILNGTMMPPKAVNFKVNDYTVNSIQLGWNDVLVQGWEVYRSTTATGTFTKIATISQAYYNDTKLVFNTSYYYKIRSYVDVDGKRLYGEYSSVIGQKTSMKAITATVVNNTPTSVRVSCSIPYYAATYEVYRATSPTGTYTLVSRSSNPEFYNYGLTPGATYYYKVRWGLGNNGIMYYSPYSSVVSVKIGPAKITEVFVGTPSTSSIHIWWNGVSGATGYELWGAKYPSTTYSLIYTGTATEYQHTGLTLNDCFDYRVRAYTTINGTKYYGLYSDPATRATAGVAIPVLTMSQDYLQDLIIEYENFVNGTSAKVYVINETTQERTFLTSISSYDVETSAYRGVANQTLKLVAVAEATINGIVVYSKDSAIYTVTLSNPPVKDFKMTQFNGDSIWFEWSTVLSPIQIFRSDSLLGEYTLIYEGSYNYWPSRFTDTKLAVDEDYFYKIRRVSKDPVTQEPVYSEFSEVVEARTELLAPTGVSITVKSPTTAQVTWRSSVAAEWYEVYAISETDPTIRFMGNITSTSTLMTGLLPNTQYVIMVLAYASKPGYLDVVSMPSDPLLITTPSAPVLSATMVSTYEGQSVVTMSFSNTSLTDARLYPGQSYIIDADGVFVAYLTAKDTATQATVFSQLISQNVANSIDFTLPEGLIRATDTIVVPYIYNGFVYLLNYNPVTGITHTYR